MLIIPIFLFALLLTFVLLVRNIIYGRTLSRRRSAAVVLTAGVLAIDLIGYAIYRDLDGPPTLEAPGYGRHPAQADLLFHEAVPAFFGGTSFERDFYGGPSSAQTVAAEVFDSLAPFGYVRATAMATPALDAGYPAPAAQLELNQWRWRFYELAMPTRIDNAYYDGKAFAHLVAIVLSDDGKFDH